MANSRHRPKHKAKVKAYNIQKQKRKEMENIQKEKAEQTPKTYTYHRDAKTVTVPLGAWQMLNQAARDLQPLAVFVSVMEQIGKDHMDDGTLLPVYQDDLEVVPGMAGPKGEPQYRVKESFWIRGEKTKIVMEKPSIIMADGKTIYEAAKEIREDGGRENPSPLGGSVDKGDVEIVEKPRTKTKPTKVK